jgi:hypothetical protein
MGRAGRVAARVHDRPGASTGAPAVARRRLRARAHRGTARQASAGALAGDGSIRLRLWRGVRLCHRPIALHAHLPEPDPSVPVPGRERDASGRQVPGELLRGASIAPARSVSRQRKAVDGAQCPSSTTVGISSMRLSGGRGRRATSGRGVGHPRSQRMMEFRRLRTIPRSKLRRRLTRAVRRGRALLAARRR